MNRKTILLIILFLVIVSCKNDNSTEISEKPIPVRTVKIQQQEISIPIHTSGILSSPAEIKLSFKVGGIIEKINVDEGESVREGQVLASLKQSEILARVNQAQSAYNKAKRDLERVDILYKDSVVTLEQKQNAETGLIVAKSDLEIAQFNLKYSRILAPSNGRILKRLAEENELVEQGTPILIFGSSYNEWIIRADVIDRDIVRLQYGDSAKIAFDAYPDSLFTAHITEIAQSASPMTGTYEVELKLSKTNEKLVSGFVGKIEIYPSKKQKFYLIPIEALIEADGRTGVIFAPNKNGTTVTPIHVKIAKILNGKIAITSNLKDIDTIITEGAPYLSEKTKIKIVN